MYKTLLSNKNDFDSRLNELLQVGWIIQGGLTSHVVGSTVQLCVLLYKETPLETPPTPTRRKRKAKND